MSSGLETISDATDPVQAFSGNKAYEVKFVISEPQKHSVLEWARANLPLDQHADPSSGTYNVTSLYFDTRRWDVYRSRAGYKWNKYRIRRYGEAPLVFLERKSRRRTHVEKSRVPIAVSELSRVITPAVEPNWPGQWFHEGILQKDLEPSLLLTYERAAFVNEQGMRVTVDTAMSCAPALGYFLDRRKKTSFLSRRAVLELKYRGDMPALFQMLINRMNLVRVSVSKYRLGVTATEDA